MSVTFGFYNSLNHDRLYDAKQMSSIFDGIIADGVFSSVGSKFAPTANGGMVIGIGSGRAWFNHTWTNNDATLLLSIASAEAILNRIDTIVLEVNSAEDVRTNTIKIIKGTPGSVPVAPTLISASPLFQYPLCNVYVGAGVVSIIQANITSKIGTSACPYIVGIVETMTSRGAVPGGNANNATIAGGYLVLTTDANAPFNDQWATIEVTVGGTGAIMQTAISTDGNKVAVRHYMGSAWSAWKIQYGEGYKPTVASLGGVTRLLGTVPTGTSIITFLDAQTGSGGFYLAAAVTNAPYGDYGIGFLNYVAGSDMTATIISYDGIVHVNRKMGGVWTGWKRQAAYADIEPVVETATIVKKLHNNMLLGMLKDALSSNNIDAWSDLLADSTYIDTANSSNYLISGGKLSVANTTMASTGSGGLTFGKTTGDLKLGQFFTASASGFLAYSAINLAVTGAPPDGVIARLYAADRTTVIASSNVVSAAGLNSTGFIRCIFNFANAAIVSGQSYMIGFERTGALSNDTYYQSQRNSNGALNGNLTEYQSGVWLDQGSYDLVIELVQMTSVSSTVIWNVKNTTKALKYIAVASDQTLNGGTIQWIVSQDKVNWISITSLNTLQQVNFTNTTLWLACTLTNAASIDGVAYGGY